MVVLGKEDIMVVAGSLYLGPDDQAWKFITTNETEKAREV